MANSTFGAASSVIQDQHEAFYNLARWHSSLDYCNPVEYELWHAMSVKKACSKPSAKLGRFTSPKYHTVSAVEEWLVGDEPTGSDDVGDASLGRERIGKRQAT